MAHVSLTKAESRKRWRELRSLVNAWDPIGLIEAGAPEDEYECIVGPLMRMLEERASQATMNSFLLREFDEHFRVPIDDSSDFVRSAAAWYSTTWAR
jgi:hypothetical protein